MSSTQVDDVHSSAQYLWPNATEKISTEKTLAQDIVEDLEGLSFNRIKEDTAQLMIRHNVSVKEDSKINKLYHRHMWEDLLGTKEGIIILSVIILTG